MAPMRAVKSRIEELRRQLHQSMTAPYDPARLQALTPISQELDQLVVRYTREEEARVKREGGAGRDS